MDADDEHEEGEEFDEEFDEHGSESAATSIEVTGLSLYTHHGVSDATVTDRVEDTVDYGSVCEFVALIAGRRSYRTLEALCTEIANQLLEKFEAREVWVKATKPEPPIPLAVESVSVEVWHSAAGR
jgi:7,8-dihydroneopterin aldolase/epimerase/oxygenase